MSAPLPVDAVLPELMIAARRDRRAVLIAPPGAGKTTRVPLALANDLGGRVVCTQPRRLAARLAARRVASEIGERVGERVGYRVRFERRVGPATRLEFVTEGVLVRRLVDDPTLDGVAALVLDEFHERTINGDLLLALAMNVRLRRPDLIVVVMSATLDAEAIAGHLGLSRAIESRGRQFPIEIGYRTYTDSRPLERQVAAVARDLLRDRSQGHLLVFLPGAREIRWCLSACEPLAQVAPVDVVTLHGEMSAAEQDAALASVAGRRKLILATNVAETSVTIEGVAAVIDAGTARVARHSSWSGLASLQVEPISRASADQRAGRAGRTGPGVCVRLYGEHDYLTRRQFDAPEVARVDLAELQLVLHCLGLAGPESLLWLDPPPEAAVAQAERLLRDLGAVDDEGEITAVGRALTKIGLHPRLARTVVEAAFRGVPDQGCALAALLSQRSMTLSSRAARQALPDVVTDPLAELEVYARAREAGGSPAVLRELGIDPGAYRRVERSAAQLRSQLHAAVRAVPTRMPAAGFPDGAGARDEVLARALLAGFPDRVCRRRDGGGREVVMAGGGAATLPGPPDAYGSPFLVAVDAEVRGRGARRATTIRAATAIDPSWLIDLPAIREVDEHRWNPERKAVERISGIYCGEVAVDEEVIADRARLDAECAALVLAEAARQAGPERFVDAARLEQWTGRLALVAEVDPDAGVVVPDGDQLVAMIEQACVGRSSFAELADLDVIEVHRASLPAKTQAAIERLAPTSVSVPGRKRVPVNYSMDRAPWIESRLQDFFGLQQGPTVGAGRVALVVHLLAPNRRAVQVTSDLAGFWERHYPAIRRQLMRRYPRHDWPENPV